MQRYIEPPLETNPETLALRVFQSIQAQFPGYSPSDGDLLTIVTEEYARLAAEVRDVASMVPTVLFRTLGRLMGEAPMDGSYATVSTHWIMRDTAGYTVPVGSVVGVPATGDLLFYFQTRAALIIAPGGSTGDVDVIALDLGSTGNGLGGAAVSLTLVSSLEFVSQVQSNAVTSGGSDADSDTEYLDKLRTRLTVLAPRPILPRDFSTMVAFDIAGVDRALAIDGYNPADSTYGNEKMIAIAAVDEAGNAVSPSVKSEIDAYLQERREVNFVVNEIDPVYTTIDVTFAATAAGGYDPTQVQAAAVAAVRSFLSPAIWGRDPSITDPLVNPDWIVDTKVRYNDLVATIKNVLGIRFLDSLTLAKSGQPMGTADVTLTGVAPLPLPGTVIGAVSP